MGKHTSHDGKTTIDTENNLIVIGGRRYSLEYSSPSHGADNLVSLYTVEDLPEITGAIYYEQDDMDICDPRDADNFGTLVSFGSIVRDFSYGDEQWNAEQHGTDFEFDCSRCGGGGEDPEQYELARRMMYGSEVIAVGTESSMESELAIREKNDPDNQYEVRSTVCSACKGEGIKYGDAIEYAKVHCDAAVALPVYFSASHGAGYGWCRIDEPCDEDTNGVIYVTKEDFDKEVTEGDWLNEHYGGDRIAAAKHMLESEVEEYSRYMEGECYWHVVKDSFTDTHEPLSGILGTKWAEESLFWEMASQIQAHIKEVNERAHWAQRDTVTV